MEELKVIQFVHTKANQLLSDWFDHNFIVPNSYTNTTL